MSTATKSKQELGKMMMTEEKKFIDMFPYLVKVLSKELFKDPDIRQSAEYYKKCLEYNIPFGRKRRAMLMIFVYLHLREGNLTEKEMEQARAVAWCIESLQGSFLVADDIMDKSITRRGKPCWTCALPNGRFGLNDALYLENVSFDLLDIFTKDEEYYVDLLKIFRQMVYMTVVGQHMDLAHAVPQGVVDFTHFTHKCHSMIVKYKTSFYTFYLPAAAGMILAGVKDQKAYDDVKIMMMKMGELFQIQDDYLDCYGDPDVVGKIGTDIQDNKCSWLMVSALERASEEQLEVLKANYGRWDEKCVQTVKGVFRELDIEGVYKRYEEKTYKELNILIDAMDNKMPKEVFKFFLDMLYRRKQ